MARRRVLKRRLYTYEQLATRRRRYDTPLYGSVRISHTDNCAGHRLRYINGKTGTSFLMADIYRTDVGTLYEVHGIGEGRNKPSYRKAIELWRRYVPVFTPHDAGQRLYKGDRARYLLTGGVAVPLQDHEVPGVWLTMPRSMVPKRESWALGDPAQKFHLLPNFIRRSRLFATRLKKKVEADDMGVVQLRYGTDWSGNWFRLCGNALQVCTPPQGSRNGRRLVVEIGVHNTESRRYFHIDGDYAIKHCQFVAREDGKKWDDCLRWKCSRDAILGIKEWIIGDIYIPGPG